MAPDRHARFSYRGFRAQKDKNCPQLHSETSRQLRKRGMCSITMPTKHHPLWLSSWRHRINSAIGKVSPDLTHSPGPLCFQLLLPLPPPVSSSADAPPMPMLTHKQLRNRSGGTELPCCVSLISSLAFPRCSFAFSGAA